MHKGAYLMLGGESTGRKRVVGTHKMKRPTKQPQEREIPRG